MTQVTIEFWPQRQYTFETPRHPEDVKSYPQETIFDFLTSDRFGREDPPEWPGGIEYNSNGIELKCWITRIEDASGKVTYER